MTQPLTGLPAGVQLRPMVDADLPFLLRVYAESRAGEMALLADWSEVQKAAFLRSQFEAQHTHYTAHYPGANLDVILRDGEDVGRLYVARLAGETRLMDIALLAAHRGQGIGGALVRALLDEARRDGRSVSLHVEAQNPARRLYRRLGFEDDGEEGVYTRMRWTPTAATPDTRGAVS